MDDISLMELALDEARLALEHGDLPVGAVVVDQRGTVVARDHNRREERSDPTAHAEVLALRGAASVAGTWRLENHTLFVTLEPCAMCAGAIVNSRIDRLVYGAADSKGGAAWSLFNIPQDRRLNHFVAMSQGMLAAESAALLKEFFSSRR